MIRFLHGDCRDVLRSLPAASVQCCVTSPPYFGLRDYSVPPSTWDDGWRGCLGLEPEPALFIEHLVEVFREVRRVLRPDGIAWVNMGDSFASRSYPGGIKPKDLIGIPWLMTFALRADGWFLRRDQIWHKVSFIPESVTDRPSTAHEYVFLLTKSPNYFFDA